MLLKEGLNLAFPEMMDSGLLAELVAEGLIFIISKNEGGSKEIRL